MSGKFANVRGTLDFDVLESRRFARLMAEARSLLHLFGYQELLLPLLEEMDLFIKGVGSTSDIVERQMFKVEGKDIVLRPEGTAQIIRYYIQYALNRQSDFHKFFYIGPMFRGERPQKGRLRQFNHIGAEAIGSASVYLDAEVIELSLKLLESLGVNSVKLHLNTLGCAKDKSFFEKRLYDDLCSRKDDLCQDCRRRLEKNPLRVIDCKDANCKKIVSALNLEEGYLCPDCERDFKTLRSLLDAFGITYVHNPRLVRGLDYYTNTVFEITSDALGAQDAIGAGGRYNNLVSYLGGPSVPAMGFALGVERILLALGKPEQDYRLDVFVVATSQDLRENCFSILSQLRSNNFSADADYLDKSLKSQMRIAQKRNASFVVIVGDEEWLRQEVIVKDMRASCQDVVKCAELINFLSDKLNK